METKAIYPPIMHVLLYCPAVCLLPNVTLHKLKLVKFCQEKFSSTRNMQQKIKKYRLKQYSKNEDKKIFSPRTSSKIGENYSP
jgi:hypothetical protein